MPGINPAAEGARLDRKGVKFSGEKGNKNFFDRRKQNIERVNERLGYGRGGFNSEESEDEENGEKMASTLNESQMKKFASLLPPINKNNKNDATINYS